MSTAYIEEETEALINELADIFVESVLLELKQEAIGKGLDPERKYSFSVIGLEEIENR